MLECGERRQRFLSLKKLHKSEEAECFFFVLGFAASKSLW